MVVYINNPRVYHIFQYMLLAVGATLMILGVLRGETGELLRKAVIVCMECIGIG